MQITLVIVHAWFRQKPSILSRSIYTDLAIIGLRIIRSAAVKDHSYSLVHIKDVLVYDFHRKPYSPPSERVAPHHCHFEFCKNKWLFSKEKKPRRKGLHHSRPGYNPRYGPYQTAKCKAHDNGQDYMGVIKTLIIMKVITLSNDPLKYHRKKNQCYYLKFISLSKNKLYYPYLIEDNSYISW